MIIEINKFNYEEYKCLLLSYINRKSNSKFDTIFLLENKDLVLQPDLERIKEDDYFYFLVIGKNGVEGGAEVFMENSILYLEYLNSFKRGIGKKLIKYLQSNFKHIKVTIKDRNLYGYYRKYGFRKVRGINEMFWKKI